MISLKQLSYALAVEKTLHFKKAAELCHVSQSTLSSSISALESHLGVQIFERNNKKVLVTQLGKVFLTKARTIKLEMDELNLLANSHKSPLSTPMSIGLIPTIGPYLLPKVLPEVRKQYPNFKLQLVEEQSHVLVDMVRNGDLDAAVLALPYNLEGLMAFEFWQEDFYWVNHKDKCPNDKAEITASELALEKLMLLKDGHCLKDHALSACRLTNHSENTELTSTSLHTLIQMVAGKMGSTLVPQMALDQLIFDQSELHAAHLDEQGPHRRIALVIRPNYVRTNDINFLKEIFIDQLKLKCL